MDNSYHVSGAKALVGAAFIEYLFYGIMYIIEGFKLQEFEGGLTPAKQQSPTKPRQPQNSQQQEESKQVDQENNEGKPTDLREIALEDSKQETDGQSQSEGTGETIQTKLPEAINDSTIEEDYDYEFENMHFLPLFVKNYQKGSIWFLLVVALACLRGAVGFVIAFAYIQFLFRVLQFVGTIFKKRLISRIGYIGATVCLVIMFFGLLIDERHPQTFSG